MKAILVTFVVCSLIPVLLGSHLKGPASAQAVLNHQPSVLLETKGTCCVTFYKDSNYKGSSLQLCADTASLGDSFNDEISSFKLGDNCQKITVYQNANFAVDGYERDFDEDVSNLKDKCMQKYCYLGYMGKSYACDCQKYWNDRISSVKIYSN